MSVLYWLVATKTFCYPGVARGQRRSRPSAPDGAEDCAGSCSRYGQGGRQGEGLVIDLWGS